MLIVDLPDATRRRVISVGPEASVAVSGRRIGIFSERDVMFGDHDDLERFHHGRIKEVQSFSPATCRPEELLGRRHGKAGRRLGYWSLAGSRRRRTGRVGFRW